MKYLYKPTLLTDPILSLIKDDPVRPEIPLEFRLSNRSEIFILMEEKNALGVLCVAYCDIIPATCEELFSTPIELSSAIFYTVWSYVSGAGKDLVLKATNLIKEQNHGVRRLVTLSPKTDLARKFHIRNGAFIFRENDNSINFEYSFNKQL